MECQAINIGDDMWLSPDIDKVLYDRYRREIVDKRELNLSHGYCPEHAKDLLDKSDRGM